MSEVTSILYIEDNPSHIELVKRMLRRIGYEVIGIRNGLEGIETAVYEQPDLILVDHHLQDIKGIEIVKCLRDKPETAHIPIVMLTANNMESDRRFALEAGCSAYATKPIIRQDLITIINQVLNHTAILN